MKKHVIAASLAAAFSASISAPVLAQNVSLSGLVDLGYGTVNAPGVTSASGPRVAQNGSATTAILITGSEDLGGGMRANFRYEMNPDFTGGTGLVASTTNTSGGAGNGYNFVGLSGQWGEIKLGRLNTPTLAANGIGNVYGTALGGGYATAVGGVFTRYTSGTNQNHTAPTRFNNAVEYTSPTFNGAQARLLYVPQIGTAGGTAQRPGVTDIGLSWATGNLNLMAAQQRIENGANAAAASDPTNGLLGGIANASSTLTTLAGNYTMGNVRVMGMRFTDKSSADGLAGTDYSGYILGVRYTQGAMAYSANVGVSDDGKTSNVDRRITAAGFDYSLSKRSNIYGRYVIADANTNSNTDDSTNGETKTIHVGIRHTF